MEALLVILIFLRKSILHVDPYVEQQSGANSEGDMDMFGDVLMVGDILGASVGTLVGSCDMEDTVGTFVGLLVEKKC